MLFSHVRRYCLIWQIFGILGSAPYEKFTKGQRLALSTILFKYYFRAPHLVSPELIRSDSFSCVTLQEGVDAGLRAQHIRLITDVWVSTWFFAAAA